MHGAGVAYFEIRNNDDVDARIFGVSSPQFSSATFHETVSQNGVSSMRQVQDLAIPARSEASLEPGGLHVMLMGAKQTYAENDPVTLILETSAGTQVIELVFQLRDVERGAQ